MSKVDQMQTKLEEKERKIDEKYEQLDVFKERLSKKEEELDHALDTQQSKLEEIAKLTVWQAKDQVIALTEKQCSSEITQIVDKYKNIVWQEVDKEAINLISKVIPRIATNNVAEFTVTNVDIPTEDTKGKLIGREWRNVSYFEKCTGVELIIDDTPLLVRLSCYDHEKRRVAKEVLKAMIKDGRINPVYIQKVYDEVVADMDGLLQEKGKEALAELNMPLQHPDITKMIWQFYLRYSYGQNLWIHSVEVAKMCEIMANEMWLDGQLAKKAGLLHDIGKVVANQWESHTAIGADVLRKYGYDEVTVNTAEWHHHDIPMISPIGWIVAACDAISASRPWARFNSKQFFIDKMGELEKLISSVDGVDKVHIMQAGREIMIFVNPIMIDDLGVSQTRQRSRSQSWITTWLPWYDPCSRHAWNQGDWLFEIKNINLLFYFYTFNNYETLSNFSIVRSLLVLSSTFWLLLLLAFGGNLWWSIIILTLVLRFALLPVTMAGNQMGKQMWNLQPKMQELQEKYKDEPEKLSSETMKLFKTEWAWPLKGWSWNARSDSCLFVTSPCDTMTWVRKYQFTQSTIFICISYCAAVVYHDWNSQCRSDQYDMVWTQSPLQGHHWASDYSNIVCDPHICSDQDDKHDTASTS